MIYFTADLHLGHKNILRYENRPWETIEEHDTALLDNWRDTVGMDDTVFVLGDFAFASIKRYAERVIALPGRKVLIAGNHDPMWIGHKPKVKYWEQYRAAGFESILSGYPSAPWTLKTELLGWPKDKDVVLSHFPAEGESNDGVPDRFVEYRPKDTGQIILCGHVHSQWIWTGNNINVGVDVWDYKPVSAETLKIIVDMAKEGTD